MNPQQRAKQRGGKMSEEIRNAIDAYLEGLTVEELRLLDAVSKNAEENLTSMRETLKATNRKLDEVFKKIDQMQAKPAK